MAETDDLFIQAQEAWAREDYQGAQILLHRLLAIDIRHKQAWQLLYKCFGAGQDFQAFLRSYVEQHFPHVLRQSPPDTQAPAASPESVAPPPPVPADTPPIDTPPGLTTEQPEAAVPAFSGISPFTVEESDLQEQLPVDSISAGFDPGSQPAFFTPSLYPFDVKLVASPPNELIYGLYHGTERFVEVRIVLSRKQYLINYQNQPVYSLDVSEAKHVPWYGTVDLLRYLKLNPAVELGTSFFDGNCTQLLPHPQLNIEKFSLEMSGEKEVFVIQSRDKDNLPLQMDIRIQHTRTFLGRNDQYWLTADRNTKFMRYADPLEELLFIELVRQAVIKYNALPADHLLP